VRLPPREEVDHSPGRPQHWCDADVDLRDWVLATVDRTARLEPTVAVILHGSLAIGSYFRPKSDVDLLVVADGPLDEAERRALAIDLLEDFDRRPIIGGIELSVVQQRSIEPFTHPMPYEFHFSETCVDSVRGGGSGPQGTDRDLAAHCTMARLRGLALYGPAPSDLIADVPHGAYMDAVLDDARWIVDGGVLESPFYGVLNLCRTLHIVLDAPELPPSKDESASWALEHLPAAEHPIVAAALECYRSQARVPSELRRLHGHEWDPDPLLAIAAYGRKHLHALL
jgi:predicted nucleotidyltransferase